MVECSTKEQLHTWYLSLEESNSLQLTVWFFSWQLPYDIGRTVNKFLLLIFFQQLLQLDWYLFALVFNKTGHHPSDTLRSSPSQLFVGSFDHGLVAWRELLLRFPSLHPLPCITVQCVLLLSVHGWRGHNINSSNWPVATKCPWPVRSHNLPWHQSHGNVAFLLLCII